MPRSSMEILIADLARELDLPDLGLDNHDYVCVQTEDGVIFNMDYYEQDDVLSWYTTVGEVPDEQRIPVLDAMLSANFGWEETGGATLCLDPEGKLALLTVSMPVADMDLPVLRQRMQDFSEMAWAWSKRISALAEANPAGPNDATGAPAVRA